MKTFGIRGLIYNVCVTFSCMGYILLYIDTGFATKTTTIISVIFPLLGIESPLTLSSQLTEC